MNFYKYSCSGNDFLIIDDRDESFKLEEKLIQLICHRRIGVGADGIILLQKSSKADFKMKIINSDGSIAEMCGNGLRGLTHFAHTVLKLKDTNEYTIETQNSIYHSKIMDDVVSVLMSEAYDENKYDLSFIDIEKKYYINTGVPHVVLFVNDVDSVQINSLGAQIRYNKVFEKGTNVNFVEIASTGKDQMLKVRTYERGVEAETFSCGTGNLACALSAKYFYNWQGKIDLSTKGGEVFVEIIEDKSWYCGRVTQVYHAELNEKTLR